MVYCLENENPACLVRRDLVDDAGAVSGSVIRRNRPAPIYMPCKFECRLAGLFISPWLGKPTDKKPYNSPIAFASMSGALPRLWPGKMASHTSSEATLRAPDLAGNEYSVSFELEGLRGLVAREE